MALHGHSSPVTCLASCGLEGTDRDLVLSGASDGTALLWSLRRLIPGYLSATPRRPAARRSPALVVRGHRGPVTACAINDGLGLALTCSDGLALLSATEGEVLLRALRPPSSPSPPPPGRGGRGEGEFPVPGVPPPKNPSAKAIRYTACALAESGYAVLAGSRLVVAAPADADGDGGGGGVGVGRGGGERLALSHELEVYTVNGRRTARVAGMSGAVRCLSTTGRGELVIVGGDGLMLEVRTTVDLAPVWSLDPNSWATIDCFSGAGGGVGSGAGKGAGGSAEELPAVECVELGPPNANLPVLMCVGTSDGSLLVQVKKLCVCVSCVSCVSLCFGFGFGWLALVLLSCS